MDDRPILIVAAMPNELTPTARRLGLAPNRQGWSGDAARRLVAAPIGVGPRRCGPVIEKLLAELTPQRVVVIGLAGGLNRSLEPGAVVVARQVIDSVNGETFASADADGGRIVCVPKGVFTVEGKADLRRRFDADAVDMETATVARCCAEHRVPWQCVRAISDSADMALPPHITCMLGPDGVSLRRVARYIATHPMHAPLLVRLGGIARRGLRRVADHVAARAQSFPPTGKVDGEA